MLGLFGLLGALFAGVVADSVMRLGADPGDGDDAVDDTSAQDDSTEIQSIFAMFGPVESGGVSADTTTGQGSGTEEDSMPRSDDVPDPADVALDLTGSAADDNLQGNGGDDSLSGAAGGDFLAGRDGDDLLDGGDSDDHLYGGEGADRLLGGAGADVLHADAGHDDLTGGSGADSMFGHAGDDALDGGAGDDSLMGGSGFDSLQGGTGNDRLDGGYGRDLLAGGGESDVVDGGEGSDTLWGQWPDEADLDPDFLNGGGGDDLLMLGAGDHGHGGAGADVFALLDIGPNDPPIQITDFNPDEDALVVLYDAAQHPDPQLRLETDANSGATRLMLDGITLANLSNVTVIDLGAILLRAA